MPDLGGSWGIRETGDAAASSGDIMPQAGEQRNSAAAPNPRQFFLQKKLDAAGLLA